MTERATTGSWFLDGLIDLVVVLAATAFVASVGRLLMGEWPTGWSLALLIWVCAHITGNAHPRLLR